MKNGRCWKENNSGNYADQNNFREPSLVGSVEFEIQFALNNAQNLERTKFTVPDYFWP